MKNFAFSKQDLEKAKGSLPLPAGIINGKFRRHAGEGQHPGAGDC
jgi:hypothetical protein